MADRGERCLVNPYDALDKFCSYTFSDAPEGAAALQRAIGVALLSGRVSACAGLDSAQLNAVVFGNGPETGVPSDSAATVHAELTAMSLRGAGRSWIDGIVSVDYRAANGDRRIDRIHLTKSSDGSIDEFQAFAAGSDPDAYLERHSAMPEGLEAAVFDNKGLHHIGAPRAREVMAIATRVLGLCNVSPSATIKYSGPLAIAERSYNYPMVPLSDYLHPL